jgi:hypothetical protein
MVHLHSGAFGIRRQRPSRKHLAEFCTLLGGGVKEPAGGTRGCRIEGAAGGRAWLQPLRFRNLGGGAAGDRRVPGRSAHECAGRLSSRLAGRAATGEDAAGLDQKPERTVRFSSIGSSARTGQCSTPCLSGPGTKDPHAADRAGFIWMVGNSSRKPLPQALTEGLPMTWSGLVDICRPIMVRYFVIYRVTQ